MARILRWVTLGLFVVGIAAAHLWYGNRHGFYDLEIYRQAVRFWLDGNDLYAFTKPDQTQGQLGFTYPPFGALVLVPFGVLGSTAAIWLYALLTLAAAVITTYWLVAPLARRHGWPLVGAMVLALTVLSALEPIRETFTFGQVNLWLAAMVLVDLLVLVPRSSRWAGVAIGLAAAIKLTPAIFIVYLLISRRRRAAIVAIFSAAATTLLSAAIAPRASWQFWTHVLWNGDGLGNAAYTFNQSIYGMLARLAAPEQPSQLLWLATVLIAAGYALWRARAAALAGDHLGGLALAGLAGALASPITWAHHLYWFAPALVVLVDVAASRRRVADRRWLWPAGFALLIALTVGAGLISWFEQGLPERPWGQGFIGFVIRNWYLLLCAALVALLPVPRKDLDLLSDGARAAGGAVLTGGGSAVAGDATVR